MGHRSHQRRIRNSQCPQRGGAPDGLWRDPEKCYGVSFLKILHLSKRKLSPISSARQSGDGKDVRARRHLLKLRGACGGVLCVACCVCPTVCRGAGEKGLQEADSTVLFQGRRWGLGGAEPWVR